MYRGEIFAYPLFLQKELMLVKPQFFAMDVACKYWPYLEKAASVIPDLQELTKMKPFLSVMHARAHTTKCEIKWSGRNLEGAGITAARVDMLTLHALGWNNKKRASLHKTLSTRYVKTCQRLVDETARLAELKTELDCADEVVPQWITEVIQWAAGETPNTSEDSTQIELQQSIVGLYLGVRQRKQTLYRQNDSSKLRHRLRRKLGEDKKRLFQQIQSYNALVPDSAIDVAVVEDSFTGDVTVSPVWPWEVHGSANITVKKRLYDQTMLTMRLQEEKSIVVLEMAQHCTWLQRQAEDIQNKLAENEQVNEGISCLLRRQLSEVSEQLQVVFLEYKTALGPEASVHLQIEEEDHSALSSPDSSEDEEDITI
ncbi:uncharacterized protein LOC121191220 isoform X2 [Toxotes jaculatrix]|nr:uncharacterized protein LOC121191220 isoform X2 [Toxotes jaculatrix]